MGYVKLHAAYNAIYLFEKLQLPARFLRIRASLRQSSRACMNLRESVQARANLRICLGLGESLQVCSIKGDPATHGCVTAILHHTVVSFTPHSHL